MLKVDKIKYQLSDHFYLFEDISFQVRSGEIFNMFHPDSVGKTCLIRSLYGESPPAAGRIEYFGKYSTEKLTKKNILRLRKEISIIPQKPFFYNNRTCYENLQLIHYNKMGFSKRKEKTLQDLFFEFRCLSIKNTYPSRLSFSELKKLSLVRALIGQPRLILADSPFSDIGAEYCEMFYRVMKDTRSRGVSWIITSREPVKFESAKVKKISRRGLLDV